MIQKMSRTEDYEAMKTSVMDVVGTHFRPEFINRIDDMVVFHPLYRDQLRDIARIQIQYLKDRLEQRDIRLDITDEALDKLAEIGFDRCMEQDHSNGRYKPGLKIRFAQISSMESLALRTRFSSIWRTI